MPALKVYTPGNLGMVNAQVQAALRLPTHIWQACILVAAPSKAAAYRHANALPQIQVPPPGNPEWDAAMGNDVDALSAAGFLAEPEVVVVSLIARGGEPAVRVTADGVEVLGEFVRDDDFRLRFIPKGS